MIFSYTISAELTFFSFRKQTGTKKSDQYLTGVTETLEQDN